MPKRHEEAEKESGERWLITYADLITLLLVFFIVMYAMGKVDAKKYKDLKESLGGVLGGSQYLLDGSGPSVIEGLVSSKRADGKEKEDGDGKGKSTGDEETPLSNQHPSTEPMTEEERIEDVEARVVSLIQEQDLGDQVNVVQEERGLSIRLKDVLFSSGASELTPDAAIIVSRIAKIIEGVPENNIRIEGHTDNIPIHNALFNDNMELSLARAYFVRQHILANSNVRREQFSVVGYGEDRPIASNETPEGRSANRRVNLMVLRKTFNSSEAQKTASVPNGNG